MNNAECWLKDQCQQKHCNDPNGCLIMYKLDNLYGQAGVSLEQRTFRQLYIDADGSDKDAFTKLKNIQNNIVDFVQNGSNLFLHSKIAGNGKTSWALRLLQSYFNKIWFHSDLSCKALFISVPRFLLELKANIGNKSDYIEHIQQNVFNCDLVIWDDIGTKSATIFEAENLLSIIDTRINNKKANIFTSNLTSKELHDALGDRLASRVCNLSIDIEFFGGDKRHLAQKK